MNTLMLHTGGARIDVEKLITIPTPPATDTWHPIAHSALVSTVRDSLGSLGLTIVGEEHATARDGLRYFGLMQVRNGVNSDEIGYVMGLRNSHDKSFPAGLSVGMGVFVCDNLSFCGDIVIGRRHTRWIEEDLPSLTSNAVGRLMADWHTMEDRIAAYRRHEMPDAEVHDTLIRLLDVDAITLQQLPLIVDQWRKPNHPEFKDRNAWSFCNAVTEVSKGTSMALLPRRTIRMHGLLDAQCSFAPEAPLLEGVKDPAAVEITTN